MPVTYKFDSAIFGDSTQFDTKGEHTSSITDPAISASESVGRIYGARRTISEHGELGVFDIAIFGDRDQFDIDENTIFTNDTITGIRGKAVALAESVTSLESLARLYAAVRVNLNTVTSSETLSRLYAAVRSILDPSSIFDIAIFGDDTQFDTQSQTITVSDTTTRRLSSFRTISNTVTSSDAVERMLSAFRSISETVTNSEILSRLRTVYVTISNTVTNSDSVSAMLAAMRAISNTVTNSDSLTRMIQAFRTMTETTLSSDTLTRILNAFRTISNTVTNSDSIAYLKSNIRIIDEDDLAVSDTIARVKVRLRRAFAYLTKRTGIAFYTKRSGNAYLTKRSDSDGVVT